MPVGRLPARDRPEAPGRARYWLRALTFRYEFRNLNGHWLIKAFVHDGDFNTALAESIFAGQMADGLCHLPAVCRCKLARRRIPAFPRKSVFRPGPGAGALDGSDVRGGNLREYASNLGACAAAVTNGQLCSCKLHRSKKHSVLAGQGLIAGFENGRPAPPESAFSGVAVRARPKGEAQWEWK